jgi:hypothetical protein
MNHHLAEDGSVMFERGIRNGIEIEERLINTKEKKVKIKT